VADLLQSQATLAADLKRAQAVVDGAKRAAAAKAAAASAPAPAAAPPKPGPTSAPCSRRIRICWPPHQGDSRLHRAKLRRALFPPSPLAGADRPVGDPDRQWPREQFGLQSTAQAQGLANDDPVIKKERDQQAADLLAAEQALLGPDAYEAFHSATRAEALPRGCGAGGGDDPVLHHANDRRAIAAVGPIDGASERRIIGTARTHRSTRSIWDTVMAQAPGFLTPTQVATLQGVAQENRFHVLAKQFDAQEAPAQQVGN